MRRWGTVLGLALVATAAAEGNEAVPGVEQAIARVHPALVRIHVVSAFYRDGREMKGESAGSGVIVSPDGYVVTNHHVAGHARRLRCTLADKRELSATLVGTDPLSDIAVIRLDNGNEPLPVAAFGDPGTLRVGDRVLAMGSPHALSQSVTMGIVSNLEMTFPDLLGPSPFQLDGEETGSLVRWIGHDAQIFPGNSGGPLVNLAGEVVGINEISYGLGGAIPADLAQAVYRDLVKDGEVRRSWLGLDLQPLLKHEDPSETGVLVAGVAEGSPAERAGVRAGDVLVAYAGTPVSVRYFEQMPALNRLLLGTPVGTEVALAYRRDGKVLRGRAITATRGPAQGEDAELETWGITVRPLTRLSAREFDRPPDSGILVTSARVGSPAAEAKPPLLPGDIVVTVGGEKVRGLPDLLAATGKATHGRSGPVPLLVGVERRKETLLTVLKVGADGGADRSVEARKAWLGVAVQALTPDLAQALGIAGPGGVRITQVYPGSAAERGGLRAGDVVLRFDSEPVPVKSPEEIEVFSALVRQYAPGSAVTVSGVRGVQPLQVQVTLDTSPPSARELDEYKDAAFDFSARDLTVADRVRLDVPGDQAGVLVTGVENGGWAALARLSQGDIVLGVDGTPVQSVSELKAQMQRATAGRATRVVIFVKRGVQTLFLELEPAWPAPPSPPAPQGVRHTAPSAATGGR